MLVIPKNDGAAIDGALLYNNMLDLLPRRVTTGNMGKAAPAIHNVLAASMAKDQRKTLTFDRLRQFIVEDYDLGVFGMEPNQVCAICMPNGAEAAVTLLATMSYCTAVPVSAQETVEELEAALVRMDAQLVLVLEGGVNGPILEAADKRNITVVECAPHKVFAGLVTWNGVIQGRLRMAVTKRASEKDDNVLMLHTSGTSGIPKLVPYTLRTIVVGASCVAKAWDLGPGDVGLNMMPMFHVGGIARNLVAPILAGSTMCFCPNTVMNFFNNFPNFCPTFRFGGRPNLFFAQARLT